MVSYSVLVARVAFSRERKADNLLDCFNMICNNMSAQTFIEGPSFMYVFCKIVWSSYKWPLEVPPLPLLCPCRAVFWCFEMACSGKPHKPINHSVCSRSCTRWVTSASPFVFLFAKYMLTLIVSLHKAEIANIPPSNCR